MTEQEKRERAIEEMLSYGAKCSIFVKDWDCKKKCIYYPCGCIHACEKLYDAGYRKVEEVRKETAKEYHNKVAQEIELHNFENTSDFEYMDVCNKEILMEFCVEVEE